jgi:predicted DCC family thiol-disulfide oxidoreductase YuxK
MNNDRPIEVYYNAVCPVCDAGVNESRRAIEKRGAGESACWIDMSSTPEALAAEGITLDDVRRHIRVRDHDGTLYKGADAIAVMWLTTPGRRWLGHFTRFPLILPGARFVYFRFADVLYWWNKRKGRW